MPKGLRAYVDQRVASGDWATPSEFVRELIRKDKESRTAKASAPPQKRRRGARRLSKQMRSGLAVLEELTAQRRAGERGASGVEEP